MQIIFDIGGTNLRLASSLDGKTLNEKVIVPTPQDFDQAVELIQTEINKLSGEKKITSIAGGIPARLNNEDKSQIIHASNLPEWSGKPLTERLRDAFHCPVKLENDCALGALGENKFGLGKNYNSVIYVAVGTGIGAAWILHDNLVQGSYSFEVGHQIIDPNGPICPSDQAQGHLEAYINEPDFKKYFTIGLYNIMIHWPAEIIILGGGVVLGSNWDTEEIENGLKELTKNQSYNISVRISQLGDEAGLYGALTI